MRETIRSVCVCVVVALITGSVSRLLRSPYLSTFLEANLILLLIALLAINTTTISVVMTKLRELSSKPETFKGTTAEMKWSIVEQVILIVSSIVFLLFKKSEVVLGHIPHADFALEVTLLAIFFYSIHILYDTAKSVFEIMNFEEKTNH
jgi:hypothetical protein